jgi:hypothetical protein
MIFLLLVTLGLGLLALGLTIHSERCQGLGSDQGISIFLSRWRFTPTLLAAIYTLLLMAMVNDIKRTEAFARLSRPNGALAEYTLFVKWRFFWFDPFDSLSKRKNGGHRNWALFDASITSIMALLIISPFLLASYRQLRSLSRRMRLSLDWRFQLKVL